MENKIFLFSVKPEKTNYASQKHSQYDSTVVNKIGK